MSTQTKKCIVLGLLAHVDAGKTTLAESLLYENGNIRTLGRVDHGNAFLDTDRIERDRGITIFSKQAVIDRGTVSLTLMDTPGHTDFSGEMERVLPILDYALLVISGTEGIQGHTRTLWNMLERYQIPVFIFINKMDISELGQNLLLRKLEENFGDGFVPVCDTQNKDGAKFELRDENCEKAAACDEDSIEEYLENGTLAIETLRRLVKERKIYPCFFGSALRQEGIEALLTGIEALADAPEYKADGVFSGIVFKISRDESGNRLTHVKVTGGHLKVKESLSGTTADGMEWSDKVDQIRIYSGEKYVSVQEAQPGAVCAVTGLWGTYAGEGFGSEKDSMTPMLEPVLSYKICLPDGIDGREFMEKVRMLNQEEPLFQIHWDPVADEASVRLMGEVQTEILREMIKDRFGMEVTFDTGRTIYKETIANRVEGVGHYEPLKHYAEVHLILEPAERGRGLTFDVDSKIELAENWKNLVLTHLKEKEHKGVLTGASITDMRITLAAGRGHSKHTEGGDFREATYRAVRQGLMKAESILLEPYYKFVMELPTSCVGRAMTDIRQMKGTCTQPVNSTDMSVMEGRAPVHGLGNYQLTLSDYSGGRGKIYFTFDGYDVCQNAEEIINKTGYDPEKDAENVTGSVFCTKGAGFYVPWQDVDAHMHVEAVLKTVSNRHAGEPGTYAGVSDKRKKMPESLVNDHQLEEIFLQTYGRTVKKRSPVAEKITVGSAENNGVKSTEQPEILLVDGYNIIHAWADLKELSLESMEAARGKLLDIMCDYQGFRKCHLIVVFDAYRVEGHDTEVVNYHNIHVVYTKEAETADQYIEKVMHEAGRKFQITVATSDRVEQVISMGKGGTILSAGMLADEIECAKAEMRNFADAMEKGEKNYLFDYAQKGLAEKMEDIRLGRKG